MILRLALKLPDDEVYVRTARLLSRCLLEDIRVDEVTIGDVESIVSELCSNAVRHAKSKATRFEVTLEYYKPKVVITVTDEGEGFVRADVPPAGSSRPDGKGGERLGGWGLELLEGMADKLTFSTTDPHGTTVRVEKNLRYDTEEDANAATERDKGGGGDVVANRG
jgi:anti-sigma regulatory factor (Ser/Thr protein kinase)